MVYTGKILQPSCTIFNFGLTSQLSSIDERITLYTLHFVLRLKKINSLLYVGIKESSFLAQDLVFTANIQSCSM